MINGPWDKWIKFPLTLLIETKWGKFGTQREIINCEQVEMKFFPSFHVRTIWRNIFCFIDLCVLSQLAFFLTIAIRWLLWKSWIFQLSSTWNLIEYLWNVFFHLNFSILYWEGRKQHLKLIFNLKWDIYSEENVVNFNDSFIKNVRELLCCYKKKTRQNRV